MFIFLKINVLWIPTCQLHSSTTTSTKAHVAYTCGIWDDLHAFHSIRQKVNVNDWSLFAKNKKSRYSKSIVKEKGICGLDTQKLRNLERFFY